MLRPAPGYSSSLNAFFAPPRAGEDDGRLAHLKRLQFESLANHAKRLPWMVPIACGFVGFKVDHLEAARALATRSPVLAWTHAATAAAFYVWIQVFSLLLVSQFTLAADTRSGMRPDEP